MNILDIRGAFERIRTRHELAQIARRNPRLLRDMGLDPDAFPAAEGDWSHERMANRRRIY